MERFLINPLRDKSRCLVLILFMGTWRLINRCIGASPAVDLAG